MIGRMAASENTNHPHPLSGSELHITWTTHSGLPGGRRQTVSMAGCQWPCRRISISRNCLWSRLAPGRVIRALGAISASLC
ncbi:hypothetical protein C2142_10160 [Streptomyces sp. CB01881]|nr:hypothetical protein C2142_10160 [Streptomyces sp. CB01881]